MVKIFSIEGNVGSGKSTLIRELEKLDTRIIFVLEPVDEWNNIKDQQGENILTKFYRNQGKYAFSFQMMAYISRLSKLKNVIAANPNATIITERSIFADKNVFAQMLYDDQKIEEVNYIIYLKWFNEFIKETHPNGFIYLEVPPKTCYNRVLKRNRCGETISLGYLERCHKYHNNWLSKESNVLRIGGEEDFENNKTSIHNLYNQIDAFTGAQPKIDPFTIHNWQTAHFC